MKKEGKALVLISIIGIVLILSINIVTASLIGDMGNWVNKLFSNKITGMVSKGNGSCVPNCNAKICGDNGCGGICGTCAVGQSCVNGDCVSPASPGCLAKNCVQLAKQCGNWDDTCGNKLNCGSCPIGQTCNINGQCIANPMIKCYNNNDCGNISTIKFCYGNYSITNMTIPTCLYPGTNDSYCYNYTNMTSVICNYGCSNGVCLNQTCTPKTCSQLGKECGNWTDGCSHQLICGNCNSSQICNIRGQCITNPIIKCSNNNDCGNISTIKFCYGNYSITNMTIPTCLNPGTNDSYCYNYTNMTSVFCNYSCSNGVCLNQTCTPKTCSQLGKECGNWTDGCSHQLICGNCTIGQTCNAGICNNSGNDTNGPLLMDASSYGNKYIVQLKDEPIFIKKLELNKLAEENKNYVDSHPVYDPVAIYKRTFDIMPDKVNNDLKKYTKELDDDNNKIIDEIKSIIKEQENGKEPEIGNRFKSLFNGFAIDANKEDINAIEKLPDVKAVFPNLMVKATMMDTVPLIKADDVWKLDSDGNNCATSGKDCITGKGVTIAIIDTGVDYTHPDLGGCLSPQFPSPYCFKRQSTMIGEIPGTGPEFSICSCTDSDGVDNICSYGWVESTYCNTGNLATTGYDICADSSSVNEAECYTKPDGKISWRRVTIPCPIGSRCTAGSCIRDDVDLTNCNKVIGGYNLVKCNNYNTNGNCISPKPETSNPIDDYGHGTHVAGIAAGSGEGGLKGVAPDAKILAYKVLNSQGDGQTDWIIAGIERAMDPNQDGDYSDHANIISMSLGGSDIIPDDPLVQAVDNAVDNGVVVVIAAGNSGDYKTIGSPGLSQKALTVGASDKTDVIADFSSKGPSPDEKFLTKPDIIAPGVNICSDYYPMATSNHPQKCLDDNHMLLSGTSMATPVVSGAVALLLQKYPNLKPDEVKSILMGNSKKDEIEINHYDGHKLDLSYWDRPGTSLNTHEFCTHLDVKDDVRSIHVRGQTTTFGSVFNINEIKIFLRQDVNGPGPVVMEANGNAQGSYLAFSIEKDIMNINKGVYWLCINLPVANNIPVQYPKRIDQIDDYYFNEISQTFNKVQTSQATEIASKLMINYTLKASVFDYGAGRLDILNALDPLLIANSSISFGVVQDSIETQLTLKNIKNNDLSLDINPSGARRVINISNYTNSLDENLIEDINHETYNLISSNVNSITIPANSEKNIIIKLNIPSDLQPGYYSGFIELTDGIKKYTIPYSFIYPRTSRLYAPPGNSITIDGVIDESEWSDAKKYENVIDGTDLYLKTGMINNKKYLFLGFKSNKNINFLTLYFDQGNTINGNFGSRNRALYFLQEDKKSYQNYYGQSTFYDFGYYTYGYRWLPEGAGYIYPEMINGNSMNKDYLASANGNVIEMAIPFQGTTYPEFWDFSDLNLNDGDIIGFSFTVHDTFTIFPKYAHIYDAMTFAEIAISQFPPENCVTPADCLDPACLGGAYCVEHSSWCSGADINKDGAVNGLDLDIWKAKAGSICSGNNNWCDGADANKDGAVNGLDLDIWKAKAGLTGCFA